MVQLTEKEFVQQAKHMLKENGLPYNFKWVNTRRKMGYCSYRKKIISVSKILFKYRPEQAWKVFLHEYAHALCYERKRYVGHGNVFKEVCKKLGTFSGYQFDSGIPAEQRFKYRGRCPNCKGIRYSNKRKRWACMECCIKYNEGKWCEKFMLKWEAL